MGKSMKIVFAFICLLLISENCFSHKDRIITLSKDGHLEGLASEYSPASLHIQFAPRNTDSAASIESISLDLGKNHVSIPICVTGLLHFQNVNQISIWASWYHDENLLPYYLGVDFYNPGYKGNHRANSGFMLMFNLRTAKLMQMKAMIVLNNGKVMQDIPVDIKDLCMPDELNNFFDAKQWPDNDLKPK